MIYNEEMATKRLKVASVTMQCDLSPQANREKMIHFIKEIKNDRRGIDLIVFGETVLGWYGQKGGSKEYHLSIAEPIPGETIKLMSDIARENNIHLSFGLSELRRDKLYNTQVLISPEGDLRAVHRKFHPMGKVFQPGEVPVTFTSIKDVRTALLVCSDIQNKEVRKAIRQEKPELIIGSLASPNDPGFVISEGIAKMLGAWIVTANRYGDEEVQFFDGSMVVCDPWGDLRESARDKEQYLYYEMRFPEWRSWYKQTLQDIYRFASLIVFSMKNLKTFMGSR
jgi:predicted amidohydrolase